jgi:hypothetical protein
MGFAGASQIVYFLAISGLDDLDKPKQPHDFGVLSPHGGNIASSVRVWPVLLIGSPRSLSGEDQSTPAQHPEQPAVEWKLLFWHYCIYAIRQLQMDTKPGTRFLLDACSSGTFQARLTRSAAFCAKVLHRALCASIPKSIR